jgi:hypothetical protein
MHGGGRLAADLEVDVGAHEEVVDRQRMMLRGDSRKDLFEPRQRPVTLELPVREVALLARAGEGVEAPL